MSQTETILLVVLGFSLAALIALFIGRMMWNVAIRLGARRMQKQVPSSLVGLQTERDRLRAEYAMLSQRLGSRLDAVKMRMAEQMAEVSRHRNRLEAMDQTLAAKDEELKALAAEVERLKSELATAAAEAGELRQTLAARDRELQDALAFERRLAEPLAASASSSPAADPEDRLRQRIGRLNEMAQAVAQDRAQSSKPAQPPQAPDDPLLLQKLEDAERETGDLQKELEQLDAEWSKKLGEMEGGNPEARYTGPAVANVISLANRIRDLKKGLGPAT